MSEEITDHLISTFYSFSGREIRVYVSHDGFSHWTDMTQLYKLDTTKPGYRTWALVDKSAKRHIEGMLSEHCVKAQVSDEDMEMLREMSPAYWSPDPKDLYDEDLLDSILKPIFWEHINPYLSPPCTASPNDI